MPGLLTEITEIATALGTVASDVGSALAARPPELRNVPPEVWGRLVEAFESGRHDLSFRTAFANGASLLDSEHGLRGRPPRLVEWKGPHRPPGDDIIPADLRIDHVYLVSCKYLSKVLLNAGAPRLFDRLLVGEERAPDNWFHVTAPEEYGRFYRQACRVGGLDGLPADPLRLSVEQQRSLRQALSARVLPAELQPGWAELCARVAESSAARWRAALTTSRSRLRLLWRLLRVSNATYFVLGTDRASHLRLRVASAWDWHHAYELLSLTVSARPAGQPEVGWNALVRDRASGAEREVAGHVEIRWSHGRFVGVPEAKVYLDSPHSEVPGYEPLR